MQPRLTVSEATRLIQETLDQGLGALWVEGEISNFLAHRSGHFYFTLKDAEAQLRCAMFRGANRRLRFQPEDGLQCLALGRVTHYAPGGQTQLVVDRLVPTGAGELRAAFEALRARLAAEGLFLAERKRPLPAYPRVIGIVTSPDGAALRDIQRGLRRRWPAARLVLRPVPVQGVGAAAELARGIAACAAHPGVELVIVGRGGGSLEDLWAFNEEAVARAIAAARVPVVSAVGHAVDTTIADYVADLRAPTPSAAAELAVPDEREVRAVLALGTARARRALENRIAQLRLRLVGLGRSHALRSPAQRLRLTSQRLDDLQLRCVHAIRQRWEQGAQRLARVVEQLRVVSPERLVARGYALVFEADGRLLSRCAGVRVGTRLWIQLRDGRLECEVRGREAGGFAPAAPATREGAKE